MPSLGSNPSMGSIFSTKPSAPTDEDHVISLHTPSAVTFTSHDQYLRETLEGGGPCCSSWPSRWVWGSREFLKRCSGRRWRTTEGNRVRMPRRSDVHPPAKPKLLNFPERPKLGPVMSPRPSHTRGAISHSVPTESDLWKLFHISYSRNELGKSTFGLILGRFPHFMNSALHMNSRFHSPKIESCYNHCRMWRPCLCHWGPDTSGDWPHDSPNRASFESERATIRWQIIINMMGTVPPKPGQKGSPWLYPL